MQLEFGKFDDNYVKTAVSPMLSEARVAPKSTRKIPISPRNRGKSIKLTEDSAVRYSHIGETLQISQM